MGELTSLGPWIVLAVALCFPLAGALLEFVQSGRMGLLPALGIFNVVGTGSFAAIGLDGQWFALKEAFFPLLIAIVVLISAFTSKPAAKAILLNDEFVKLNLIQERLNEKGNSEIFAKHLQKATLILAGSFLLSAVLNYVIATHVFQPISQSLSETERLTLLNSQVERMTWLGFAVIALPTLAVTGFAFFQLLNDLRRMTGLSSEEIFRH
jgi:hypothetical protein